MALLDILIIVGVVLFIASRFLSHQLPQDTRPKGSAKDDLKNLVEGLQARLQQPPAAEHANPAAKPARSRKPAPATTPAGTTGLAAIQAADPSFDEASFTAGVRAAYSYFMQSWNSGDKEGLDNLCGPQLLASLTAELDALAARGLRRVVQLEAVDDVSLEQARMNGRTAIIEVLITARQAEDDLPLGQRLEAPIHQVQTRWVLARAVNAADPNWELQSIHPAGGRA